VGFLNRTKAAATSPLCRRNFAVPCLGKTHKGSAMKKLLVAVLVAASFISFEARAQNRAGDAALGAVSGAVVLGPVGAVAGAVIGYTAGPAIAHSCNRIPQRDGKRLPRSARRHPKKLRKPLPIKRPRHRCRDSTKRIAGDENRRSLQKNLTRRANHRHIFIIARIEPAPGNRPRVF
jgi:hypothetical protein